MMHHSDMHSCVKRSCFRAPLDLRKTNPLFGETLHAGNGKATLEALFANLAAGVLRNNVGEHLAESAPHR